MTSHPFLHPDRGSKADTPETALAEVLAALEGQSRRRSNKWPAAFGRTLLSRHLESLDSDFVKLMRGDRVQGMDVSRRDMIVSLFYGLISDSYVGVDSHKPSEFFDAYPTLLQHLSSDEMPTGRRRQTLSECHGIHTVRILPITQEDLRADAKEFDPRWDSYIERHRQHSISLLQVDPDVAKRALIDRIGRDRAWTGDIGVWSHACALLFEEPSRVDTRSLQLIRRGQEPWTSYLKYISDLLGSASVIDYRGPKTVEFEELSVSDQEDLRWSLFGMFEELPLAERWEEFVDPEKREATMGNFLDELLEISKASLAGSNRKKVRVLDAAAGVGPESLWLIKNRGSQVSLWSNEIDWTLAARFEDHVSAEGQQLTLSMYDWRHLATKIREDGVREFDVIFALGNSLTCLLDVSEMERCLENFFELAAPGGYLVLDERNFRKLSDRKRFDYRKEFIPSAVVYCGDIKAKVDEPGRLGVDNMILAYYEADADVDDDPIGRFTVFPFDRGQVRELIERAGFRVIKCYSDLVDEENRDAWFFTYLARKPKPGEEVDSDDSERKTPSPTEGSGNGVTVTAARQQGQPWDH